ncbi:YHS domain-containing (seleno)protein [Cognatishimia sp. SS12]|uniref:YHS domain-containing (seleno)protein n=1 Tax=Cognatishimia sp. SS12 TaxID=2979465 RepID=UPI00232BC9CB|nr:YHS domain-containing (seleno)protein [Cognatishimia sp. SS12]MDC0738830.1 YHS domain-containing (seleno)protein [Cognatishimia sp. SS12]
MFSRRSFLISAAATPALLGASSALAAATPAIFTRKGVAINGYDPVAYFTEGTHVKGSADFALTYQGASWHFASAAHRDRFAADPLAYAPQYGGYCAYAVANGYTAKTDPDAWTVHDGKLYLNFNKSIRRRWLKDVPGHIARGDANWPAVLDA